MSVRPSLVTKLNLVMPLSAKLCFVWNRAAQKQRTREGRRIMKTGVCSSARLRTKYDFADKCVPKCNLGNEVDSMR
jgi:hypothetical protein